MRICIGSSVLGCPNVGAGEGPVRNWRAAGMVPLGAGPDRLKPVLLGGLAVFAVAAVGMHRGADVVADELRRAVGHGHVEATGMGAAEAIEIGGAAGVLGGEFIGPAVGIEVVAGEEAVVVCDVVAGGVVDWVEVFLTEEVGVAHAVAHVGGPHFAALGGEAGGRAHVGEAVISKAIRERWAHVSHGPMAGLDFLHQGI